MNPNSTTRANENNALPSSAQRLGFGKKILFVGIIFAIAFVFAEVVTRAGFWVSGGDIANYTPQFITSHKKQSRFIPHPFLPYANRPNDERTIRNKNYWPVDGKTHRDIHIKINSKGFRGKEWEYKKPPGTVRVLCYGGSTTFGSISEGHTWPEKLEHKLQEQYPDVRIEVLNMAADNGVSHQSLINFAFHGIHCEPDLVIIYHLNDTMHWGFKNFRPDYSLTIRPVGGLPLSTRIALAIPDFVWESYLIRYTATKAHRYTGIAPSLRGVAMKMVTKNDSEDRTYGSYAFFANLRSIRALAREYGSEFLTGTVHRIKIHHQSDGPLNVAIRKFCKEQNAHMVDLDKLIPHEDKTIHVDNFHFTDKGTTLMAEAWGNYIIEHELLKKGIEQAKRTSRSPASQPTPSK